MKFLRCIEGIIVSPVEIPEEFGVDTITNQYIAKADDMLIVVVEDAERVLEEKLGKRISEMEFEELLGKEGTRLYIGVKAFLSF